jgi:hypothetical protein
MTRLILTTSDSAAGCLRQPGIADVVLKHVDGRDEPGHDG